MLFLFMEGLPLFADYPLWDFLTGHLWYPTSEPPEFGIFPLIMGSLAVTILASCIAVPLGIMTAAYLAESRPAGRGASSSRSSNCWRRCLRLSSAFSAWSSSPRSFRTGRSGYRVNLLNAALMLAFMSVPTICSVAEDALFAVPRTLREASLALGATRWETLIRVVIPSALSGIGTAVMLGMSRAIGETMVVLMVAGGAAIIPLSIFDPVRPMPASIAAEMAEAPFRGDHYFALFATGIVLFLFTLLFNMLAFRIAEKHKQTGPPACRDMP